MKTLAAHRYGKSRVRLMKVLRDGPVHTVKELTARVLLEGAFDRCYTASENAGVIATDTMKNTLNVLAHECLGAENEPFARRVASHFLERYAAVSRVTVTLDERVWSRLHLASATPDTAAGADVGDAGGHPHTFKQADVARPFTRVVANARGGVRQESGIRKLILLKSTGSGFAGFHRDDLTTLPETGDRILASSITASWRWRTDAPTPASYADANRQIVDALIVPFAERFSASVQATLFDMATAALDACPAIGQITLTMPNLHCLPIDLTPFGRTNRQELFVPTDEPHGYIEATVTRGE